MKKENQTKSAGMAEVKEVARQIQPAEFWLCVQFADVLIRYLEITMKEDNVVSRLQGTAMYFLVLNGGRMTPTQMAKRILRSKHSVTKIIDSLEKEELIVRDYTDKDRRVTYIKITPAGLEYVKQRFNKGNVRAQNVLDCLDAGEQKLLIALTEKMRRKMISTINEI
jgi:DNA-binding MarR family transcriptional regulator